MLRLVLAGRTMLARLRERRQICYWPELRGRCRIFVLAWRRNLALLVSVAASGVVASYFLVAKHYDYGAFKILVTGWVPMLLVCTLVAIDLSIRMRRAAAVVAVAVLIVAVIQVARFERSLPIKSIPQYADLYNSVPRRRC
jgi:hypothetical protein